MRGSVMYRRERLGKFTNCACLFAWISTISSGLIYLALPGFAEPARAEEAALTGASSPAEIVEPGRYHRFFDHAALSTSVDFVDMIGAAQPKPISLSEIKSPHPQIEDTDVAVLRDYIRQIGT